MSFALNEGVSEYVLDEVERTASLVGTDLPDTNERFLADAPRVAEIVRALRRAQREVDELDAKVEKLEKLEKLQGEEFDTSSMRYAVRQAISALEDLL